MANPAKRNLISASSQVLPNIIILGRVRSAAAAAPATGGHQSSLSLSHWDLRIILIWSCKVCSWFLRHSCVLYEFVYESMTWQWHRIQHEQANEAKEPPFFFFGSCILPMFCCEETQVIVIWNNVKREARFPVVLGILTTVAHAVEAGDRLWPRQF